MFDDLRRNFVMNPQSGLKIRPFKNAATAQATDRELLKLSKYLTVLKDIDDFKSLDHRNWEKVKIKKDLLSIKILLVPKITKALTRRRYCLIVFCNKK